MRCNLRMAAMVVVAGTAAGVAMGNPPEGVSEKERGAAAASNAFGLELFRALGKEDGTRNVFVSPYSMSVAMTMCAEGARGETGEEMARVLRFGEVAVRGSGRPITPVHAGHLEIAKRFAAAAGSADPATRKRIEALRKDLAEANAKTDALQNDSGKWEEAAKWSNKGHKIADELNALLTTVDRFDLRVANALWVEQTFPLVPEYVKTIDTWYGTGGVTPMDFRRQSEKSRARINGWVEEHTEKRIKDLLPAGSITAETGLVITNAVYFRGEWADPFKEVATKEEDFTGLDGKPVKVRMMQDHWRSTATYAAFNGDGTFFETPRQVPREGEQPPCYPGDDGFTMIEMPYKGGELSMVVMLPRKAEGLGALESRLTGEGLGTWVSKLESRTVDAAMPRFKMEYEREMSGVLKGMGMKRAFVSPGLPDAADFGGMSASTDPAEQLYIGLVQHKAWVEVTEKGTEAAAATAVVMMAASAMERPREMVPFNPVFRADHPFVFVIRDVKNGVVLFVGRVARPG